MGYFKRLAIELHARAFSDLPDRRVCLRCVSDDTLRDLVAAEQADAGCSYCGASGSAPLLVLLEAIQGAIEFDYSDPAEELPFESREGGYQGEVLDGSEIVWQFDEWTVQDRLIEDVADAFSGSSWCKRNYFGFTRREALHYGWARFSYEVKHRMRHLFLNELDEKRTGAQDEIPPGRMLEKLGSLFAAFRLVVLAPKGTEYHRARVVLESERPTSAAELGTAPRELARWPNRMSPAGIPMFYGASDEETAVLETFDPAEGRGRHLALARFRTNRPLRLLDLTNLPSVPNSFDTSGRRDRDPLAFLRSFAADLSKPIARDGNVHIDYVPTQVVTEYVRHGLRSHDGFPIDGVVYRSSRNYGAPAVVIFADPEHCGPPGTQWPAR